MAVSETIKELIKFWKAKHNYNGRDNLQVYGNVLYHKEMTILTIAADGKPILYTNPSRKASGVYVGQIAELFDAEGTDYHEAWLPEQLQGPHISAETLRQAISDFGYPTFTWQIRGVKREEAVRNGIPRDHVHGSMQLAMTSQGRPYQHPPRLRGIPIGRDLGDVVVGADFGLNLDAVVQPHQRIVMQQVPRARV